MGSVSAIEKKIQDVAGFTEEAQHLLFTKNVDMLNLEKRFQKTSVRHDLLILYF